MNLGYACINQHLSAKKIMANRGMIRKTFDAKGLPYVSELILKNLGDLKEIIKWNAANKIYFYRMSSDMFPWMSEYEIEELPDVIKIKTLLQGIGLLAKGNNIRLSFHPGPFNVLASANEKVVEKTIKELDQHAQIMDLMGLEATPFNKINIHIGTALGGNKAQALRNFCANFPRLKGSTKQRLTIENDDKPNMFTVRDLYDGVHKHLDIPIVFDYHHHWCNSGGIPEKDALLMAVSTWKNNITPVVHYSEPRSFEELRLIKAHADHIFRKIDTYGMKVDIMIEAKEKESAVQRYRILEQNMQLAEPLSSIPYNKQI